MRFDKYFIKDIIEDITPILILVIVLFVGLFLSIRLMFSAGADLMIKMAAAREDIENPIVISERVNNSETKIFTLVKIDNNYYIGQGFIDGELYYIFRVKEEASKPGYVAAPVYDSEFVYDGKNIVEVTRSNVTQKYRSRVNNKIETMEVDKNHYVFHVPNNQIKDYGVIQQKVDRYTIFFPLFIPLAIR